MGEPSGLIAAIEGFIHKVGELGAKLMDSQKGLYETIAEGLGALMSGTGRLIAAASSRFSRVKAPLCISLPPMPSRGCRGGAARQGMAIALLTEPVLSPRAGIVDRPPCRRQGISLELCLSA